ncbi:BamA/TamA family outer membrane protein [Candidatus Poribacteria bacterium]|nr:BamA/TamA family outer membrane protein [Candidatus Poribacteria bacterium]
MKYTITKALMALLLLISPAVQSQSNNGTVAFDCPNLPSSEFQFDLDRRVIALVMEEPTSNIAPLFNNIDNLHLRNYRSRSVDLKEVVQYYGETLKARSWNILGHPLQGDVEDDNLHLYTFQVNETLQGIFVIVKSGGDVYLINIVGEIPKKQLGGLLLNLHQLGIEIPELMSLKPRDLEIAPPPPLPTPKVVEPTPAPVEKETHKQKRTHTAEEVSPSLQETQEPATSWNWTFDGEQIHDIQIQGVNGIESANIVKILENGSGDVTEVMPILTRVLLNSSKKASLRVDEADAKRVAIINVEDIPVTRTISVLRSLNISGSRGDKVHKSSFDKLILQKLAEAQILTDGTRFRAGNAPIHEIRIQGNQKISEAQIQQALENGSEDLEQALKTLYKAMPYFEEVNLKVDEENSKYIATITVDEKPLSNTYLGLNPPIRFGFNRVTGWEIGTGFEVGKRKDLGPLWAWRVSNSRSEQTSNFFGKASYAFGNPHVHYRMGGTANWGKPYIWNLGLTAQIHRLTDAVAPEMFPNYNNNASISQRVIGIADLQNYYLRQGAEIALRWAPVLPTHAFKLAMVTESHASLQKSTDWFVANWKSNLQVRDNPPISPGRMRSLTLQYDFKDQASLLGWHNTLLIEHSNAAVGSDFDFTRLLLHLRYAFRLQNNRIRTRFLFGFSDSTLPIQRQFVIDGMGGLRGYSWRKPASESEGPITYKSGHRSSPYTFAGDRGFLLNIEYHHRLSNLLSWRIFRNAFAIVFFDEGQVWNVSGPKYIFDPKGNIGLGLQFGAGEDVFRVNIAKAFESSRGIHVTTVWSQRF